MRGLGGLFAGSFTTTQRDAIASGFRPYGLVILNTTVNRLEWNSSTDASPNWQPVAPAQNPFGAGILIDFAGIEANKPANTLACDGAAYSTTTQAALYARIGNTWDTFSGLAAPGAGLFRVPDLRGRGRITKNNIGAGPTITGVRVARATAANLAALIGEEFHTLIISELPAHDHGGITGSENILHGHTGTSGTDSVDHSHNLTLPYVGGTGGIGGIPTSTAANIGTPGTTGVNTFHTHVTTTGTESAFHQHAVTSQGGGGTHENTHPVAVVNTFITTV